MYIRQGMELFFFWQCALWHGRDLQRPGLMEDARYRMLPHVSSPSRHFVTQAFFMYENEENNTKPHSSSHVVFY